MALSNKQTVFVNEYLKCWNATKAARRAGYSPKTARSIGAENLTKPDICAEIKRRVDEHGMSANEVLMRLAEIARAGYGAYITECGVDLQRMIADGKGHLIKHIRYLPDGLNIEFHDAQAALVHIGKHHKLFTGKHEPSGTQTAANFIVVMREDDNEADEEGKKGNLWHTG